MARRKLVKLKIAETSGVDHPAHLHDGWVVMKSSESTDITSLLGNLRSNGQLPADVEAKVFGKNASPIPTSPMEEQMSYTPKRRPEMVVVTEGASESEVVKAMPSVIKKMLDDSKATAEAALRKAAESERALIAEREARADEAAVIKAAEWSHLNIDPTVVGPALRRLAESDEILANEVVKALDSANSILETNVVFTEVGADAPVATNDAYSKLDSIAKAAVASGTAASYEEALLSASQANPDLYTQYLNEKGR